VRIAGVRLQPAVARLLSEMLETEGFPETAGTISTAIKLQVTVEAPLASEDYESIIEVLNRGCPPALYRLHRELLEDQRYIRRVTGG
jgi:hypothetical protein